MKHMRQFNEYLKMDIRSLFFYLIGTVILISTYLICHANNIPLALLFRDPSSSGGLPFYAGWISYLGVAIWAAGSSIILFTSHFLKNTIRRYCLALGIFMMLLLIDDFFMLHDGLFGVLHIPEILIYFVYGFFAIIVLKLALQVLQPEEIFQLVTAFGLLGISIGIDVFQAYLESHISNRILFEDGFKLLGIIGLFFHSLTISSKHLHQMKKIGL